MRYQDVQVTTTMRVPVGYWLVQFFLCWNSDEDGGGVHDVDEVVVSKITERDVGFADYTLETNADSRYVDDTHDFRDRIFETEEDARAHAEEVLKAWRSPNPWQVFVRF